MAGQTQEEFEAWLRMIERELRKGRASKSFGKLNVEMLRGDVVRAELVKSIKDPKLLEAEELAAGDDARLG